MAPADNGDVRPVWIEQEMIVQSDQIRIEPRDRGHSRASDFIAIDELQQMLAAQEGGRVQTQLRAGPEPGQTPV